MAHFGVDSLKARGVRLEVLSLESGAWVELAVHEGHGGVRAPPFAAIELEFGALWI